MTAPAQATAAPPALSQRARTIALWVVLLAFFMDLLDTTIVNVAIPSIQAHLGTSYSAIQWIIAGYSLAFALFLITGGRLGDIHGYKTMFLAGMAGFVAASAASGLAPSTAVLIAARLAQGFSAAMMVPQILSTIQVMYPIPEERQVVSAYYGALGGVATVAGPILGALLVSGDLFGLGWRTIFLVNVPVGIAAMLLAWRYLPMAKSPNPLRLDLVGVAIVVAAMLLLMYPLIQGRELGWSPWTFAAMAASLPAFLIFAWSQVAKDRRDGSPLVVPRLFAHRSFVAGLMLSGVFFAVIAGFFLILTLFLQVGLGYDVLTAGLTGIPFSLGVSVAAGLSGPVLVPRFGRVVIQAGPVVLIAGLLAFLATIDLVGGAVTPFQLVPSLLLQGAGMGFVVASLYPFILADVPIDNAGSASGVVTAVGQIGGAAGVALVGVIFFGLLADNAATSVAGVRDALRADLTAAGLPPAFHSDIIDPFEACFRDRGSSRDFGETPESCRQAEAAQTVFAFAEPGTARKIVAATSARAAEANQRNFTAAVSRAIWWEVAGLIVVFAVSFLLPRRPRRRGAAQPAAAG
jgi:EmrB/QacA subfamily drug resistance transporter